MPNTSNENNETNVNPNPTTPGAPNEDQNAAPSKPDINPGKVGNETEVDLDRSKNATYPDPKTTPPERH